MSRENDEYATAEKTGHIKRKNYRMVIETGRCRDDKSISWCRRRHSTNFSTPLYYNGGPEKHLNFSRQNLKEFR
jgi:hypothetical protein